MSGLGVSLLPQPCVSPWQIPSLGPLLNAITSHNPFSVVNELIKILSQARKGRKQSRERDVGGRGRGGVQDSGDEVCLGDPLRWEETGLGKHGELRPEAPSSPLSRSHTLVLVFTDPKKRSFLQKRE